MEIRFYSTQGHFGFMSNFSAHAITVDGLRWPTVEHYFQAQKFAGTPHVGEIRAAKSPSVAARMGRSRSRPLRHDWESVKESVMKVALRAKFTQHAGLTTALLETGDKRLVEDSPTDRYWGCGSDGRGLNRLGALLMELRSELRAQLRSEKSGQAGTGA